MGVAFAKPTNYSVGVELWRNNLSGSGMQLVGDIAPGSNSSNPRSFCDVPGVGLFFFANPKSEKSVSLYWTGPPNTLKRLKYFIVNPNAEIPIKSVGHRAVFIITDTSGTRNLWSTNGTIEGTFRIRNTGNYELSSTGSYAFFVAYQSKFGFELFQTDGTIEGTFRVPYETIAGPKNSNIAQLTAIIDNIYFTPSTKDSGKQLFRYHPEAVSPTT